MTAIAQVSTKDFSGTANRDGAGINIILTGNADSAAPPVLDELLTRIHDEASKAAIREAVVDLRQLEFMNSSSFKSLISWIMLIKELEENQRYRVKFVSNPEQFWQKRSLETLRCFADELISVVTA